MDARELSRELSQVEEPRLTVQVRDSELGLDLVGRAVRVRSDRDGKRTVLEVEGRLDEALANCVRAGEFMQSVLDRGEVATGSYRDAVEWVREACVAAYRKVRLMP